MRFGGVPAAISAVAAGMVPTNSALQRAQHEELPDVLDGGLQRDRDRRAGVRAQEHVLAAEAVGERAPERRRDEEHDAGRRGRMPDQSAGCDWIFDAEVLDEEGDEGKDEVGAHQGEELRHPDGVEILLPRLELQSTPHTWRSFLRSPSR